MANATNGPVDPDAGIDRRGRAERSRAQADPASPPTTPTATPARRTRTVAATSTTRSPVTAQAESSRRTASPPSEPARKTSRKPVADGEPARKPVGKKSTTAAEPAKPAAVKSTSSRSATTRAPARKTATSAAAVPDEEPKPRRRATRPAETSAEPSAARSAEPRTRRPSRSSVSALPAEPEPPAAEVPEPPAMTRGILELAAERLAASQAAREPAPEPPAPADDDPLAAPGAYLNPRAAAARRSGRSSAGIRAVPGGTRPGTSSRPPLASRPPAGPPEAVRPHGADPERWDGLSPENGWLGTPGREDEPVVVERPGAHRAETLPDRPDPEPHTGLAGAEAPIAPHDGEPVTRYPRTRNRPGLPPSVRLPAELPDNLWPPPALMDRSLAENIYVPAPVPPRVEEPPPVEARTRPETKPDEEIRHTVEVVREEEHESAFLPSVLARGDHDAEYVPAHSRDRAPARHAAPEAVVARRVRRRRRAALVAYLMIVVLVLIAGHQLRARDEPLAPGREAARQAAEPAGVGPVAGPEPPETRAEPVEPDAGADDEPKPKAGEFKYARDRGPMLGSGGKLYRFRVAVEKIVEGTRPGEFAESIDETLGDERSWINDGRLRLRRVADAGDDVDFTIYLASARTSEKMCAEGGLQTEGFTSCRIPGQVIINADRWADAVPDYEGELEKYRQYTINHEVGHELGHGHEKCPGEGEKAPVMMQQTFGLKGCTPNPWPYLDGERYAGEPVA